MRTGQQAVDQVKVFAQFIRGAGFSGVIAGGSDPAEERADDICETLRDQLRVRVVPVGRQAVAALNRYLEAGRPKLVTPRSPANVFLTRRGTPFAPVTLKEKPLPSFTTWPITGVRIRGIASRIPASPA